jgi:hypothetical protein
MSNQPVEKGSADPAALPRPCRYFPLRQGRYDIKPGLFAFGTDFGNGEADRKLVQVDDQYAAYRREKLAARKESLPKYYRTAGVASALIHRVAEFLIQRAAADQPDHFRLTQDVRGLRLDCRLSGEILSFRNGLARNEAQGNSAAVRPGYVDAFDAIACQLQEDLAVVTFDPNGPDTLRALHLCLPNYWSAEEKIGRGFAQIHAPVPGMAKTYPKPDHILRAMSSKGPCVRFVWGLVTDPRLNHHPHPPPNVPTWRWHGRDFNHARPRMYLRVERQVLWGLGDAALFLIRTYLSDCDALEREEREHLYTAIAGMTEAQLRYKGLAGYREAVLRWLLNSPRGEASADMALAGSSR